MSKVLCGSKVDWVFKSAGSILNRNEWQRVSKVLSI